MPPTAYRIRAEALDDSADVQEITIDAPANAATLTGLRNGRVYAITMIAINPAGESEASEPVEVALESGAAEREHDILIDVLTGSRSEVGSDGKHCLFLEGYGYHWFRVGGLDALLKRTPG